MQKFGFFSVHSQAATFHQVVTKIEGENMSAVEVINVVNDLKENLKKKKENIFLPLSVKGLIKKLEQDGLISFSDIKDIIIEFYGTCVEYLDQWSGNLQNLDHMQWGLLKKVPTWPDVEKTLEFLVESKLFDPEFHTEMFDDFAYTLNYINEDKISEWNKSKLSADQRWVEIFTHFKDNDINHKQMAKVIQYIFCLPGTNASTERVFSQMNKIWTIDKSQLNVSTLKALLILKYNFKHSCLDFYKLLKSTPDLLTKIISSEKYKTKM